MGKYYTPEIEEFHVGFEYEFHGMTVGGFEIVDFRQDPPKTLKSKKQTDKIWSKEKIYRDAFEVYNRSFKTLEELIKSDQIRVKYLDREDIESLGFKCTGGAMIEGGKSYFEKESYGITLRPNYYKNGSPDAHIYKLKILGSQISTRFSGEVKNKSRLKKLLQQLNIE